MELVEKLPEIKERINPKAQGQIYKFAASLALGEVETYDVLSTYDVYPVLPSQLRAYTVDARSAKQALELASKMGFIENIKHNPNLVSVSVSEVIKRMGQCDAVGIPYRDEETGLCADFIFDARKFKTEISPLISEGIKAPEVSSPITINNLDVDNLDKKAEIKKHANELLEVFTLTSDEDRNAIMAAIDKMDVNALSEKEILLATFTETFAVGNMELLSSEIDRVLDMDTVLGRKAA